MLLRWLDDTGDDMRAFLLAVVTCLVITGVSSFVLESWQAGSDKANTTSGARVDFAKDGVNRSLPR